MIQLSAPFDGFSEITNTKVCINSALTSFHALRYIPVIVDGKHWLCTTFKHGSTVYNVAGCTDLNLLYLFSAVFHKTNDDAARILGTVAFAPNW